jgi:hypothetical protein
LRLRSPGLSMMSRRRIVIVSVISLLPVAPLSRVLLTGEDNEVQVSKAPASASSRAVKVHTRPQDVWDGISTSLDVRSVKKVNSRMWIILALFSSKALRIETESGKLVRQEQAGTDLFEFTLVKPRETERWLLGRASVPEEG